MATLNGGSGDDVWVGTARWDSGHGNGGDDKAWGEGGDDVLAGDAGNDQLAGGDGADMLLGDEGDDYLQGDGGNDRLFGSTGRDRLYGNTGNDDLTGGDGNDHLYGGAGVDTLNGGLGADWLAGGTGADRMEGGVGNDTYEVDGYSDVVIELAGQGSDFVRSQLTSYTLGANLENLQYAGSGAQVFHGIGNQLANVIVGGLGNDSLEGLAGTDTLTGGGGNDTLNGGAGADVMQGGQGNDIYHFDSSGDRAIEIAGQGYDMIVLGAFGIYDMAISAPNVEAVMIAAQDSVTVLGNAIANTMYGTDNTAGTEFFSGGAGNDELYGLGGDDFVVGGAGNDVMDGGAGRDTAHYFSAPAGVVVDLAREEAPNDGFGGTDTLLGIEIAHGSQFADAITGNGQDNTLYGNGGDDTLSGRGGDDWLHGGDGADAFDGGSGFDFVSGGVGQDEGMVVDLATGQAAGIALGDTFVSVEGLIGSGADDGLRGDDGANTLMGALGDDVLLGRGGADTLRGDLGADVLTGGTGADTFVFKSVAESEVGGLCDRVTDFSHAQGDHLRLEAIDANTVAGGNQAFAFIGTAAFSGAAGQLRAAQIAGNTYVFGDVDGDGAAELSIRLDGLSTVVQADFVL